MCDGYMGGAGGPCYNTPMNTMGIGDVVPPTATQLGSGDCFNNIFGAGNRANRQQKKRKPEQK